MSYIDENGFAFIWGKIKDLFQAKELKTGSTTNYKELTDNNLTDTLKSNYDSAYTLTSSLTATASELNQLDGVTLGTAAESTVSTSGVSNNSTNLVTEAQVKTYVDSNVGADIDDTAGNGDTDKVWSADKVYDELATKVNSSAIDDTAGNGDTTKLWSADKVYDELGGKVNTSAVGANSGVCPLDSSGKVASSYLPSYVDDVVEGYYNSSDSKFYESRSGSVGSYTYSTEITGETGKIYLDLETEESYRYGGSAFVKITNGALSPLTNNEITAIITAS